MKYWYKPNFLAILALVILSLIALKSLAIPNFYTSHDGETHTARMAAYFQALADGQWPPRFAGSFYNGLGSPIFVYIYPLPYFLGSLVHSLGFSFSDSFEIVMAAGFFLSAIFAYLWLNQLTQSPKAAFLGALFYVWIPYRFLLIYVRGSISENTAYAFLPLTLFFLTKLSQRPNILWTAASALSTALLLLSQNLVAAISLPIVFLYLVIVSLQNKSKKSILFAAVSIAWGFLISSFVYLPTIFEREFTRFDEIIRVAYPDHFVTLKQLIRSAWGYGFDLPGTLNDQMSLQIGLAHIFVFLISSALVFYQFLRKQTKSETIIAIYFISSLILSIFLMLQTKLTSYIWQQIKVLHSIDIPWRLLGLVSLSLAYLTAYTTKHIKPGLLFLFFIALVLVANRNHLRINQMVVRDDKFFTNYYGTATQYDEFTPKWRQSTRVPIGFNPSIPMETVSGDIQLANVINKSNEVSFIAQVNSDKARVRINKFYFPGVNVRVDGQKLTPFKDLTITDTQTLLLNLEQDASGLMMIKLERGQHRISARFGETKLRLFANFLSLSSLLMALAAIVSVYRPQADHKLSEREESGNAKK